MRRLVVFGLLAVVVAVGLVGGTAAGHPDQVVTEPLTDQTTSTFTPPLPTASSSTSTTLSSPSVSSSTASSTALSASDDQIRMTTTLDRTPERTGEITATVSFQLSSRVTELTARLPEGATVTSTNGFSRETEREYAWDERTDGPTVTYRIEADRLVDADGPLAEDGRYLFADTDDWALVRIPSTGASWTRTGSESDDLAFIRETAIDGPGAAGDRMAFLGDHRIETHTAHGQTFRLVVPDAADVATPVAEIFDSLSHASNALRVGSRDEEVFIVAAPTDNVDWAVRGLQTGQSDMWVQDTEPLDTPLNVWVHEYVHTRQAFEPTAETEWFIEGGATYYAALLTLEQNRIEFEAFQQFLRRGESEPQSTAVLSEPDSWQADADYEKGALVAGELDRQIRLTTDSRSSLEAVFRSLNQHDGELSGAAFDRYITQAATTEVGGTATRYTTTDATPRMWSSDQHATAFGQAPARFSFELADDEPLIVTAPNGSTRAIETVSRLSVGDSLTVRLTARNIGDTVGSYQLPFAVGNETSTQRGQLTAGETRTHEFTHTFDEPGIYTIAAGDERIELTVEPASTESQPPVDVEVPGFGLPAAVVALVVSMVALRRRSGRP